MGPCGEGCMFRKSGTYPARLPGAPYRSLCNGLLSIAASCPWFIRALADGSCRPCRGVSGGQAMTPTLGARRRHSFMPSPSGDVREARNSPHTAPTPTPLNVRFTFGGIITEFTAERGLAQM